MIETVEKCLEHKAKLYFHYFFSKLQNALTEKSQKSRNQMLQDLLDIDEIGNDFEPYSIT